MKKLKADITFIRDSKKFVACVRIPEGFKAGYGVSKVGQRACGQGSNPRAALASAFTKIGEDLKHRWRGAFAGRKR